MKGERLGDHTTRDDILHLVERRPGITIAELEASLGINRGTLRYHLDVLLNSGMVRSRKEGNVLVLFKGEEQTLDGGRSSGKGDLHENRILELIRQYPGITRKQMVENIGLSRNQLTSILGKLQRKGMIWKVQSGKETGFEIATEEKVVDRMYLELVQMFLDGIIDEKRFLVVKGKLDRKYRRE